MNEEQQAIEDLVSFSKQVLDNKEVENRAKAAIPIPTDSGVRSSWQNQPHSSKVMEAPRGRHSSTKGSEAVVEPEIVTYGAFYRIFQNNGRHWLQGGQVTGSIEGNEVINDINLAAVGSEPSNGTRVWIKATGSGNEIDDILYPGFKLTNASVLTNNSTPTNTSPTADSPASKDYHILLGIWNNNRFSPSASGNIQVGFCGSYQITRF